MQAIPVEKVLDVSSEHPDHKAFSLVTGFGQWKTELPGEEKAELLLKLDQLVRIARIEVANESSAWLDIRVSREGTPFAALLPTLCLQSRRESKEGDNVRVRKILEAKDFNEELRQDKFDLVKVICRQPFNRSILFGLSYLKFFTYPPEEDNKKPKSKSYSGACQDEGEEVVLEIVHDSKENNANSNQVAALAIKNACIQDINREKRFVNTPLNDGDPDPDAGVDELRPKSVLKHLFDSSTSTTANLNRTPLAAKSPGIVKPAFVFAPKTSAAEQEARAKKAAAEADKIIPGRSPKKMRSSIIATPASMLKETPTGNSSVGSNSKESETPRRVPPPKVSRNTRSELFPKSKERVAKRRSVALDSSGRPSDFDPVQPPTSKKAKTTTDILERIFSSSEDESSPSSKTPTVTRQIDSTNSVRKSKTMIEKTPQSISATRRSIPDQTDDGISEDSEPQPGPSWRVDPPRKNSSKNGKSFTRNHVHGDTAQIETGTASDEGSGKSAHVDIGEHDSVINKNTKTGSKHVSPSIITKAEVQSDGEDLPIVIKNEVIELDDSDNEIKIESPKINNQNKAHEKQKKKKRNRPAVNCEVESDSDIEVVGNDLMRGVVFALSGFKNPYRSSLRSMAIAMGAKYRPDWDDMCTHLVCAFKNTPKYNEVRRQGGRIVTAAWIATSHLKQQLADWKKYRLD